MALTTRTVARFGLDHDGIARLNFEAQAVSAEVLRRARSGDRFWGTEKHYAIAERGVEETYRLLVRQHLQAESVLLPAIKALRADLDDRASRFGGLVEGAEVALDNLVEALVSAGTVADVIDYLRTRIADWDVPGWGPGSQVPSAVERPLKAWSTDRKGTRESSLSAREALAGQRMLVVLAGPGSGKSWLARRYAREAAQAALATLEAGSDLAQVELPLLTTWDQWIRTSGEPRRSLVASSFAAGLGHRSPERGGASDRLRRTFLQEDQRVLLVLDSLDEAADVAAQHLRLREIDSMSGWRVVVTSRPANWNANYRGAPEGTDVPRVILLQDLEYPHDVERFIRAWFEADPGRGNVLAEELRARGDLARLAVIPLMLTFYCLLAEDAGFPNKPLPARRQELYRRLVRRLLRRKWSYNADGPALVPDMADCEALLRLWAWSAVRDRVTPSGLGKWADAFVEPEPQHPSRRVLEGVAPRVAENDEGDVTRQFMHRALLEHFVAEHVATLDADEAAAILLPHLWYDPDWEVAAPAAIAAHNRNRQAELLQRLLAAAPTRLDAARRTASSEFDRLLMAIAVESAPDDWIAEHRAVFDDCRVRMATGDADAMARTSHWHGSNAAARAAVLAALSGAEPWEVARLLKVLPALEPTANELSRARAAVLAALPGAEDSDVARLLDVLPGLGPTDGERAQARAAVLEALTTANPLDIGHLLGVLPGLVVTAQERAEARAAVLKAVPAAHPEFDDSAAVLASLVATVDERDAAVTAVLVAITTAAPRDVDRWVEVLHGLADLPSERSQARRLVRVALAIAAPGDVAGLTTALLALEPTATEQLGARAVVRGALATAAPRDVRGLTTALLLLQPTAAERIEARDPVRVALAAAAPGDVAGLVEAMLALEPTATERVDLRASVRVALAAAAPLEVAGLANALLALEPTAIELAEARASSLAALTTMQWWNTREVLAVLPSLVTTAEEQAEARRILLSVFPIGDPWDLLRPAALLSALDASPSDWAEVRSRVMTALRRAPLLALPDVVTLLLALKPSPQERAEARRAVLAAFAVARVGIGPLSAVLPGLVTTAEERAAARAAVLTALPAAAPWEIGDLVAVLLTLITTVEEQAEARAGVLHALSNAASWLVGELVTALPALTTSAEDWAHVRVAVLAALPTTRSENLDGVVAVLRHSSTAQAWQAWLRDGN